MLVGEDSPAGVNADLGFVAGKDVQPDCGTTRPLAEVTRQLRSICR